MSKILVLALVSYLTLFSPLAAFAQTTQLISPAAIAPIPAPTSSPLPITTPLPAPIWYLPTPSPIATTQPNPNPTLIPMPTPITIISPIPAPTPIVSPSATPIPNCNIDRFGNMFCTYPPTFPTPTPTFTPAPTPIATPSAIPAPTPIINTSYYLEPKPSNSIVMVAPSAPGTGYAISVILKKRDGTVLTNQQDINYSWKVEKFDPNQEINLIPFSGCTNGIQEPCPNDHASITVSKLGYTSSANVWVTASSKSTNIFLAKTEFTLNFVPSASYVSLNQVRPGYTTNESYAPGQQINISWLMVSNSANPVDYFNLTYQYYEKGVSQGGYIKTVTYPTMFTSWIIPEQLRGKQARIIIDARKNGLAVGQGYSSYYFNVGNPTPQPTTIPLPSAPELIYPRNGQTLDLEGAYMFKVKPIPGASGYSFSFVQNNQQVYQAWAGNNGLLNIWPSDPAHAKFKAGSVSVQIKALVNNYWSNISNTTIILKPRLVQPQITSIWPNQLKEGRVFTISGKDFGSQKGQIKLYKSGVAYNAPILVWSNNLIITMIPNKFSAYKQYGIGIQVKTTDNRQSPLIYRFVSK